jgi:hypothetical protein
VKPDRSHLDEVVFRDGIAGKTLLDIGTLDGRLCFEAMRRGAKRALGIDLDAANVTNARAAAARTGVDAEFIEADFEHWRPKETFDVVRLGTLDDLFDPIHTLRRLTALAREKIVLEISVRPARGGRARRFGWASPVDTAESTISLRAAPRRTDGKRAFLFTPEAIGVLLNEHSLAFEPISVSQSALEDQVVIGAKRRKIAHLTVVAGPVAVGKSHLISRLAEDALLRERAGIPEVTPPLIASLLWKKLPPGPIDHAVLHYNILRPLDAAMRTFERDPVVSLFPCAEKITFLTIRATRERLCAQLDRRIAQRNPNKRLYRKDHFYRELRVLYEDDLFVDDWYDRWLTFVSRFKSVTAGNYIVSPDEAHALIPVERSAGGTKQKLDPRFATSPA